MSTVINDKSDLFKELSPKNYYSEEELERVVIKYLQRIFVGYKVFIFKADCLNPITLKNQRPDLGLIKNDYTEWFVIEVELGSHGIKHVAEQIDTFSSFRPTQYHVDEIYKNNSSLFNKGKLKKLILNQNQKTLVIVNEEKPSWVKPLKRMNCEICIFQIYNNHGEEHLYRIHGNYPSLHSKFCYCTLLKSTSFIVEVKDKNFLTEHGVLDGDKIDIFFNNKMFPWSRKDSEGKVFLISDSYEAPLNPMPKRYKLSISSDINQPKDLNLFKRLFKRSKVKRVASKNKTFTFIKY